MALPLRYNWRSLSRRPTRALLTALGIGLAVFVSVMMLALATGLTRSIRQTGHPLNALILTKGAETMEFSAIDRRVLDVLRYSPYVAEQGGGQRLASPELYFYLPGAGAWKGGNRAGAAQRCSAGCPRRA